jgi:AraC-like DNA-binding protein
MKFKDNNFAALSLKIIAYCELNYAEIETLSDIVDHFNYNYQYLRRVTLQECGKTPLQILDEIRLNKMKQLLTRTDLSCRHIGIAVGFLNEVRTCRFFKRGTGISMSEYRKAYLFDTLATFNTNQIPTIDICDTSINNKLLFKKNIDSQVLLSA